MGTSTRTAVFCAGASVLLVSVAQLAMRWGMMHVPHSSGLDPGGLLLDPGTSSVVLGLVCYGVSMLCWVAALRTLPLRVAYPMLSASYAIVYVAASMFPAFDEHASTTRSIGVLLILCGISVLVSGGAGSAAKE